MQHMLKHLKHLFLRPSKTKIKTQKKNHYRETEDRYIGNSGLVFWSTNVKRWGKTGWWRWRLIKDLLWLDFLQWEKINTVLQKPKHSEAPEYFSENAKQGQHKSTKSSESLFYTRKGFRKDSETDNLTFRIMPPENPFRISQDLLTPNASKSLEN